MKRSIIFVLLLTAGAIGSAFMLPEDKLRKSFWQELTAKEKHVFLMGYRVGTGPSDKVSSMPEAPPGFLVLSAEHFDEIIKSIDSFYRDSKNINVRVGGAIEIAIMKMQKKKPKEIEQRIKFEQELIYTSF